LSALPIAWKRRGQALAAPRPAARAHLARRHANR
jgi:hypothetical protein